MGKVPCEFQADQPGCSFSGEELRQGSLQPCPAQDGASSMAGGSWHDLAHLLWAALLQGGFRYGPAVFNGWCPHNGAGPLWVLRRLANLYFSVSSSWRDLAHLLWAAVLQGGLGMDLLSSGDDALMMGQVPCDFWGNQPTFIFQAAAPDMIRHIYCGQGWRYGPAIFRGSCTHQGTYRGP